MKTINMPKGIQRKKIFVVLAISLLLLTGYLGLVNIPFVKAPLDTSPPSFGSISSNTTYAGNTTQISCAITDDVDVSSWRCAWNNSGSWVNSSAVLVSGSSATALFNGTFESTVGDKVSVQFWANDSSDNAAYSNVEMFTLTVYNTPAGTLFYDDFESGVLNPSKWAHINNAQVQSTIKKTEDYALNISSASYGDAISITGLDLHNCTFTFWWRTDAYASDYIDHTYILQIGDYFFLDIDIVNITGRYSRFEDANGVYLPSVFEWNYGLDTWYNITLHFEMDISTTNADATIWIDGTQMMSVTGMSISLTPQGNHGYFELYGGFKQSTYFDDMQVYMTATTGGGSGGGGSGGGGGGFSNPTPAPSNNGNNNANNNGFANAISKFINDIIAALRKIPPWAIWVLIGVLLIVGIAGVAKGSKHRGTPSRSFNPNLGGM